MDETSLISKLEFSDSPGICGLFSDYLSPFSDLTDPPRFKRSAKPKPKEDRQTLARSLAKRFLPFLNRALGTLPKRLADPAKLGGGGGDGERLALELFDTYRLCLNCLESVSSQLLGKPFAVQVQRMRMVRCIEAWGRWKEVEAECFEVLKRLKEVDSGAGAGKSVRSLLPDAEKGGGDEELGRLVAEIVVKLVKCVSTSESNEISDYSRIIRLVEESRPWFRVLDANTYEKLHRVLITYLGRCASFIVGELKFVDEDLARAFCFTTMVEHAKSSIKDQIYKVARRICSSLFSLPESRSTFTINILTCLLDSLVHEGKVEWENNGIEFVELIAYCSYKCQASPNFCSAIGAHLNKIADSQVKRPFHWILRLYAIGLLIMIYKMKSKCNDISSSVGVVRTLCAGDVLQSLAALLCSLRSYFHNGRKENCTSISADDKDAVCLLCSLCISQNGDYTGWTHENGKAYVVAYLNALKFVCLPLAEVVSLEKKQIISRSEVAAKSIGLCHVQEAFYQFSDAFVFLKRCKSIYEAEKDGFDETNILGIAVASFIVSLGTKLNMQKSMNLLKDVISSEWIQPNGLKHLFSSLYNVGVILYKDEQVEEALKALKLSYRASWTCVLHLCDMFAQKPDGSNGDLSEDAIVNFVNESCTRNAFLLNSLHQRDSQKVKRKVIESLENWSVAANLFRKLPSPVSLVKQWVKIECQNHKNGDVKDSAATLYNVLSPSEKVSKRTIGVLLEQELHAYAEVNAWYPDLCQKMQMKIIEYLLEEVYATPESWLQRSRILVQKGRVLRFYGHGLKDCIQCLSDAISSLKASPGETCNYGVQTCHQLAVAYCLRACCTQEAEPNSKQVFQDIRLALKLWFSITNPDCFTAEEECFIASESTMILLYNISDLLSLKGCMDFHYDIYRLMFRLFRWKKVPLEKSLAVLWECRRLRHALCVSPVNEAFLMSLADHYHGLTQSIDFWISCLKGSKALLVGFEHSFSHLFANFPRGSFNHESSFRSNITVEEVRNAACQLISGVPASSSVFVAGYLFYDLSERLILNGHITEALTFAKEALRLRATLFGEKFKFSVEQQPGKSNEIIDATQMITCSLQDLQVRRSVANELWSFDTISWDLENCYLSPWIILQCYLESILQAGVACELIGNGAEAEGLFLWGKSISCLQNLPLFMATFSSVLGKLFSKKQLWDLAEKELQSAKQYLESSSTEISCSKCRLMLDVTVEQHLGDLFLNIINNSTGKPSIESSSRAEALYKSALDMLNHSEWGSSASCPEVACCGKVMLNKALVENIEYGARSSVADIVENQQDINKPSRKEPKGTKEDQKCRKTRNVARPILKEQNPMAEKSSRTTRSKNRSSQSKSMSSDIQDSKLKPLHGSGESECSGTCGQTGIKSSKVGVGCEGMCICNKMRCWHCLQIEVMKNGLLNNYIDMKWEFFCRRLLLRLLTGLGNCLESRGQIHEAHEIFLQSIFILVNQDLFHLTTSSVHDTLLLDIIGKEVSEDMFIVERAELLYNLSWASLKCHNSRGKRVACCDMSIQLPQLVACLMQVFVSCCEVPMLFQKVSRLLAVIFLLAAAGELCSLSSSCKALSENQWASFFHQASVGTHLNYQFFTNHDWISKVKDLSNAKGSYFTGSNCPGAEMQNLPRLAPESIQDLEEFVQNFFAGFPCTTAICVSLLGGPYAFLLQDMLHYDSSTHAWMLVSRLESKSQPIVLLLPMDSVVEASDGAANFGVSYFSERKNLDKHWQCPWGSTMVDNVAPEFRLILEENYISSSSFPLEDTEDSRKSWWIRRKQLDHRLGKFLRDLEDLWLGPWKYMLLGQRSSCKSLDSISKKLARSLKSKCKIDVNESLLRVILGAPKDAFEEEEFVSQLCLRKGCHIGRTEWHDKDRHSPLSSHSNGLEKLSGLALQLVLEAVNELENEDSVNREPMMLVLDFDVQMLPWENLPMLRNQEIYRMPSVWSISALLCRSFHNQEQAKTFPFIDPLDAFYLLNPGGDLSGTQIEFEKWFTDQNLEGKAGNAPTAEELAAALKSHDLFLYFGHGSGTQYIPGHEIQKLKNCAATLLMGCSSGSLTLNGCYAPKGTPLSYLLASSPVTVANLWEVTDKDIDRFAKTLLEAWFKERVSTSSGCAKCKLLAEELESLSLKGRKGNAKKKVTRNKLPEPCEGESVTNCCDHRPKIGSFIAQARDACTLPFLIGASPVCYGVPTGIRTKKDS